MKKLFVAVVLAGLATTASAAIANSSHDLTIAPYSGTISACQFCHAPHNVNTGVPGAPLWNRNGVATGWNFYTSNTVSAMPSALGANSQTCMSCHDGTSDMGDTYTGSHGFGGTATSLSSVAGTAYAVIGGATGLDLTNDHPVSITYVPAANKLEAITTVTNATNNLKLYGAGPTIECASCHDPHGTGVVGGGSDGAAGGEAFLRAASDTICTICHLK